MKIQLPKNWKEIAGVVPLSYQRLAESETPQMIASKVWPKVKEATKFDQDFPRPTEADVKKWAEQIDPNKGHDYKDFLDWFENQK